MIAPNDGQPIAIVVICEKWMNAGVGNDLKDRGFQYCIGSRGDCAFRPMAGKRGLETMSEKTNNIWRNKAEEAFACALRLHDHQTRKEMLAIASSYASLSQRRRVAENLVDVERTSAKGSNAGKGRP